MLRIPNPQPNLRISPKSVQIRIRGFFAAVSDGFGSSVCESIFTYQVVVFKRRCVTQRLLALPPVIVLSVHVIVGKDEVGSGTLAAGSATPVIGKKSAQCAWCMLHNNPINEHKCPYFHNSETIRCSLYSRRGPHGCKFLDNVLIVS